MTDTEPIILYCSLQIRAIGTWVLLEGLGTPYDLQVLNLKAGTAATGLSCHQSAGQGACDSSR